MKGRVGGRTPNKTHLCKCGKWLRIGCRLRQKNSNFDFSASNDFNSLASPGSTVTPEVASSSLVVPARIHSPSLKKTGFIFMAIGDVGRHKPSHPKRLFWPFFCKKVGFIDIVIRMTRLNRATARSCCSYADVEL